MRVGGVEVELVSPQPGLACELVVAIADKPINGVEVIGRTRDSLHRVGMVASCYPHREWKFGVFREPSRGRELIPRVSKQQRAGRLWPQLEAILKDYLRESARVGGLLFPSPRLGGAGMVTDFRKALDAVAERAGWKAGEVRSKTFRHTYCAARLQTLDNGAPVSIYTVSRELGHGGESLVKRVYGHLGEVRHRSEVVEYRVEQHEQRLERKLRLLRSA